MWSIGIIAFVLKTGKYPFEGRNAKEIMNGIFY